MNEVSLKMICKTGSRRCVPLKITKETSRTPLYILGFVLLFASTTLVLTAISTNNWQITVSTFRGSVYYTSGLWFSCKNIYISWYQSRTDLFCSSILSTAGKFIAFGLLEFLILILIFSSLANCMRNSLCNCDNNYCIRFCSVNHRILF